MFDKKIKANNYFETVQNVHFHQYGQGSTEFLSIIVLTSTQSFWQNPPSALDLALVPHDRFGEKPQDWQPFAQENIFDLLTEFQQKSTINLMVYFLDLENVENFKAIKKIVKNFRDSIILLADTFSLLLPYNKEIAALYNETNQHMIRGCLFLLDEQYTKAQADFGINQITQVMDDLHDGWQAEFFKTYAHTELAIPDKTHFFRRLANIAYLRGIEEKDTINRYDLENTRFENTPSWGDI